MKFALLLTLSLTAQSFAAITTDERREALARAPELVKDKKIQYATVTDEIGTRLTVELAYQDTEGSRKCSYSYDRVLQRVLKDSWTCDF